MTNHMLQRRDERISGRLCNQVPSLLLMWTTIHEPKRRDTRTVGPGRANRWPARHLRRVELAPPSEVVRGTSSVDLGRGGPS